MFDILGEGVEEMVSEMVAPVIARATTDPEVNAANFGDVLLAGLSGAMLGAIFQSGNILNEAMMAGATVSTRPVGEDKVAVEIKSRSGEVIKSQILTVDEETVKKMIPGAEKDIEQEKAKTQATKTTQTTQATPIKPKPEYLQSGGERLANAASAIQANRSAAAAQAEADAKQKA